MRSRGSRRTVESATVVAAKAASQVNMDTSSPDETRTLYVFLIRGVIAIAWAVVFAAVAGSLTTGVTGRRRSPARPLSADRRGRLAD
jgi:hypothetical protein